MCLVLKYYIHIYGYRWRGKCLWAPTWWACKAPPTTAHAPPLMFHPCTQKQSWWVSPQHTHTHTCIFSCLPILCNLIWDFFYLLFYWYGNNHPCKIHNTSMSIRKLLSFCCSYTCSHTHTRLSLFLSMYASVSDVYLDALNIHLCLCCLLALVRHGGDLIRNKAVSQSSRRQREREKEKERNRLVEKA